MTGLVNWYLAGMEHKGKYEKEHIFDKVLNPYWYYALIRKYIFRRPIELDDVEMDAINNQDNDEDSSEDEAF